MVTVNWVGGHGLLAWPLSFRRVFPERLSLLARVVYDESGLPSFDGR